MLTDTEQPYVYAVEEDGDVARLLVINTDSNSIEGTLDVGFNATDMSISYPEARLYVTNWQHPETQIVDLSSQTVDTPILISDLVQGIDAGRPGRVYVVTSEHEAWVVDSNTGEIIKNISYVQFLSGAVDPTGSILYLADEYGADEVTAFDITSDDPMWLKQVQPSSYPRSEELVLSVTGNRLFWGRAAFDGALEELWYGYLPVVATTARAELVFSSAAAFDGENGDLLAYLPVVTEVMAVSGDQQKLLLYDHASDSIQVVGTADIRPISSLDPVPDPADGATVSPYLDRLAWTPVPHGLAYDLYLGDDFTAVSSATTASPEYVARVDQAVLDFDPPVELDLNTGYFWRVDVVGGRGVYPGPVWSMTTGPIRVAPSSVSATGIVGTAVAEKILELGDGGTSVDWTASCEAEWLELNANSGSTPAQIVVSFQVDDLQDGVYTTEILFDVGGEELPVPVRLELRTVNITRMITDPDRGSIYALHEDTYGFGGFTLLFFDDDPLRLAGRLPIGDGATDLSINREEGRLYVTNFGHDLIRVVDLESREELPSLAPGLDARSVDAGRSGRIYVENGYDVDIVDTQTGTVVGELPGIFSGGNAEVDSSGQFYYYGEYGSSGSTLQCFGIGSDTPSLIFESLPVAYPSYDSFVLSRDGNRLFWGERMYDAVLEEIAWFGVSAHAATVGGEVMVTETVAIDTLSGEVLLGLPFATSIMTLAHDQHRLHLFNPEQGSLTTVPLPWPIAVFSDGFESGSYLRWSSWNSWR